MDLTNCGFEFENSLNKAELLKHELWDLAREIEAEGKYSRLLMLEALS
ncbi:hypothetical protein KW785_01905 [Candidatus Parcubacteria bacterium]|nr:hypothetical protein [Candidatus Parcubacteria bacterium]